MNTKPLFGLCAASNPGKFTIEDAIRRFNVTRTRIMQLRESALDRIAAFNTRDADPLWDLPKRLADNLKRVVGSGDVKELCRLARSRQEFLRMPNMGKVAHAYIVEYCQRKWPELMATPKPPEPAIPPAGSVEEWLHRTELSARATFTVWNNYGNKSLSELFADAEAGLLFKGIRNCGKKTQREIRVALGIEKQ